MRGAAALEVVALGIAPFANQGETPMDSNLPPQPPALPPGPKTSHPTPDDRAEDDRVPAYDAPGNGAGRPPEPLPVLAAHAPALSDRPAEITNPYQSPGHELAAPHDVGPAPWGFWATIGWSVACLGIMLFVQTAAVVLYIVVRVAAGASLPSFASPESLAGNGDLMIAATLASPPFCLGFLVFLVYWRRCRQAEYFGWKGSPALALSLAWPGLVALVWALDLFAKRFGHEEINPFVQQIIESTNARWMLLLAVVIVAPVWEELFFRGFMFYGIERSPAGKWGAIVITTILFTVIHLQYDWVGMVQVGGLGLYLAIFRAWTGSTALTIQLHAINNFFAMVQAIQYLEA